MGECTGGAKERTKDRAPGTSREPRAARGARPPAGGRRMGKKSGAGPHSMSAQDVSERVK